MKILKFLLRIITFVILLPIVIIYYIVMIILTIIIGIESIEDDTWEMFLFPLTAVYNFILNKKE